MRLQPEDGAAVPHQVELHVAPAPDLLPEAVRVRIGRLLAALGDGQVRGHEGPAHFGAGGVRDTADGGPGGGTGVAESVCHASAIDQVPLGR